MDLFTFAICNRLFIMSILYVDDEQAILCVLLILLGIIKLFQS